MQYENSYGRGLGVGGYAVHKLTKQLAVMNAEAFLPVAGASWGLRGRGGGGVVSAIVRGVDRVLPPRGKSFHTKPKCRGGGSVNHCDMNELRWFTSSSRE